MSEDAIELNAVYKVFTADHDCEHARREFVRCYGHEPEQMTLYQGMLFVGPAQRMNVVKTEDE